MASRAYARWGLVVSLLAVGGCGDDDAAPADGGGADASSLDARVPTPLTLEAAGSEGRLVVETDPLRFRVERADGSVALASVEGAFLLGTSTGGDRRYHSPLEDTPRGVTFRALDHGLESVSATEAWIGDADGRRARLSIEAPEPGAYRILVTRAEDVTDVAVVRLRLAADDGAYHGLGERFGHADARGTVVPMQMAVGGTASGTNEHHVPIPFFASSEGYGLFVASREAGAFDVAARDETEVRATFEGGELDLWIWVEDDPREAVARYARHTGLPRLPPRWAFAPMHWRNEWTSGDAAREDMARIRAEGVPTTSFWIDNPWQVSYNDHVFDEVRFPEPAVLLADMRAQGYVPLVWSTPYLDAVEEGAAPTNEAEELFLMAREQGWLVTQGAGGDVFVSPAAPGARGGMIDFTQRAAIDFWKGRLEPLIAMGVRSFKLDYGEEILAEIGGIRSDLRFGDGTTERERHNVYNTLYHQPYREVLDEGSAEGGFLLVRGSSWGGQAVADIVWPGDLDNDMREGLGGEVGGLPAAITALISLAASGFPNFGSDTGGYRGGMPEREVLLRWAEHTAFTPILQLGGAGAHHNPWLYDAEAGAIYRELARAHMDLVPYLRMHAIRASETGYPPVSAPALAYPEDRGGYADPYAYLLGDDLFVAPVTTPGATDRTLHLPPGKWMHWSTGVVHDGPADLTVAAPIGTPPVFVRVGAVLPLLPGDIDTLFPTDAADVVDHTDRPWLRAWILPAGTRAISTEEGIDLAVSHTGAGLDLDVTPRAGGLDDLRMRIDLARADPPLGAVTAVTAGGAAVPPSPDADTVQSGCDGACWFRDADTLWLSIRSPTPTSIQLR